MKKAYVTPVISEEVFEANEYVAACIEGTLECALPGQSSTKIGDYGSGQGKSTTIYTEPTTGLQHGSCGEVADVSFGEDDWQGYETRNGKVDYNRTIFNVKAGTYTAGNSYWITWQSSDGANTYTHTGQLVVSYVDNDHPNHS